MKHSLVAVFLCIPGLLNAQLPAWDYGKETDPSIVDEKENLDKAKAQFARLKEKGEDDFEKNLIYISTGAIGISFAFIEKIVDLQIATDKCMLIWSWIFFGLTLFISLMSHYVSGFLAGKVSDQLGEMKGSDEEYSVIQKQIKRNNYCIDSMNYISIIFILVGLLLLIWFVSKNI